MELREEIVTKEAIYEKADADFAYLYDSGAAIRNEQRWPREVDYWKDEYLYQYIDGRIDFLDDYFGRMR